MTCQDFLLAGACGLVGRVTASKQDGLQDVKIFSRNIDYLQELYPGVKAHLGTLPCHFPLILASTQSELDVNAHLGTLLCDFSLVLASDR